jgi:RNA polymerase sigma factor (sigma-70 family)
MLITVTDTAALTEHAPHTQVDSPVASRSNRLTASEEAEFARAWRINGSKAARDRLITANLGLVVAIAQRYRGGGVPLDELIAEGNLGLVHAVDGFNPECGSRFSTYAAYWIRQGISRAFAASSPRGRLSGQERRDLSTYERAMHRFYTLMGCTPTDAEMADLLSWTPERIAACRNRVGSYSRPTSLEQPRAVGAVRTTEPDRKAEQPTLADPETHKKVVSLLSHLSPHERAIVEMRFGLHGGQPRTIGAISRSMNCSKREISDVLHAAMASLSKTARRAMLAGKTGGPARAGSFRHDASARTAGGLPNGGGES